MIISKVNRTDAEKIFINVHNTEAVTATTGRGLSFVGGTGAMAATSTDGISVVMTSGDGMMCMLAGIASQDIPADGYGLAQAWGFVNSIELSAEADKTVGVVALIETFLKKGGVSGTFTSVQTPQALSTFAYRYVQALNTTNISGGLVYAKGFIRAL
jgi:hypothetical protein